MNSTSAWHIGCLWLTAGVIFGKLDGGVVGILCFVMGIATLGSLLMNKWEGT